MKKIYVLGLAFSLSVMLALPASAEEMPESEQPDNVFISEINWAGSPASNADEWIELVNPTSETVDLSGWILTGAATSGEALSIQEGFELNSESTALLSNYSNENEKSTLDIEPDLVTSSLSLSNSTLEVLLLMSDGTVIDEVSKDQQMGSTDPHTSMVRVDKETWESSSDSTNLKDVTQLGTPGIHAFEVAEVEAQGETLPEEETNTTDIPDTEPEEEPDTGSKTGTESNSEETNDDLSIDPELEHNCSHEDSHNENLETQNDQTETDAKTEVTEEPESAPVTEAEEDTSSETLNEPEEEVQEDPIICECETETDTNIDTGHKTTENAPSSETETNNEPSTEPEPDTQPSPEPSPEPTSTEQNSYQPRESAVEAELISYNTGDLLINELVSNPEDGTEWIEIYNSSDNTIDLLDWGVMDASGKLTTFPNAQLDPGGFYIVEDPAGNLNNGGDTVHLFDPSGFVIDEVTYGNGDIGAPQKGESLARFEEHWKITKTITRAEGNLLPEETSGNEIIYAETSESSPESTNDSKNEPNIDQASTTRLKNTQETDATQKKVHQVVAVASEPKNDPVPDKEGEKSSTQNDEVRYTGMITAEPGLFGKQIAFMEGVQLYFHHADWPKLQTGDVISVKGTPSVSRGEERVKISDKENIQVLGNVEVEAKAMKINKALLEQPGSLIRVSGEVVELEQGQMTLEDETGKVKIVAHGNTDIHLSSLTSSTMEVVGIIRKFGDEVRLYPRSSGDLSPVEKKETATNSEDEKILPVAKTQSITPWIGGGLTSVAIGTLAYWYIRNKGFGKITELPNLNNSPSTNY